MAERSAPTNARRHSLPVAPGRGGDGRVPDDCTVCGACCFSVDPSYIAVFEADRRRLDERALALTVERDGRRFMRFEGGRCSALASEGGRHLCSIYPMRPDACRWLERGSGVCRDILAHPSDETHRQGTSPLVAGRGE